ncbi:MAG: nucleotidyltransferase domain-containing protein [Nanoarchaeota archaeon]
MKKVYNFLGLKALSFFIDNSYDEIHLREFSRRLKISVNSAQRFLEMLLSENLIKENRKANLRYFKANLDSIAFRHIKLAFFIKKIEDSRFLDLLQKKFSNVMLFGSTADGRDDNSSDIDLVCFGKERIDFSIFEKKLGREINSHYFTLAEWKKQKEENKAFYQEVVSGINLVGDVPVL